jgi:predicted PurR-regulated permease PerM
MRILQPERVQRGSQKITLAKGDAASMAYRRGELVLNALFKRLVIMPTIVHKISAVIQLFSGLLAGTNLERSLLRYKALGMDKLFRVIYRFTIVLLFIILLIFALKEARLFLYPLVLGVLFSYLLYPMARWLEQKRLHRIPATLLSIVVAACIIGSVVYIIYWQLGLLAEELPQLQKQAQQNINSISQSISSYFGLSAQEFKDWVNRQAGRLADSGGQYMTTIFSSTTSTLAVIGIMPVYIFLLLYYRNKFLDFVMMIWPQEKHRQVSQTVTDISSVTRRYMTGVFIVVLILCILNSAGLMLIGLKFALLLGILSALCNFIPYFGTLIGALFPLTMAIFTGESPREAISVIILFIVIQFTENNILTPNITGGSVQINPMATILGLIAGGMLWGIPGMFSIVPVLGMLKIVFEKNSTTKPIAFLLGTSGTEKYAISMDKIQRKFRIWKNGKR